MKIEFGRARGFVDNVLLCPLRRPLAVLALGLATTFGTTAATAADYAPILPKAPQSLLLDIVQAGERLVAVGELGHVVYSDDGGNSWQQARVPTRQMLTSVFFISPRKGWATGHDGLILVTEDGGASWRQQRDGLATQQQINLEIREAALQQVEKLGEAVETLEQAVADAGDAPEQALLDELDQHTMDFEDAQMDLEDAELTLEEPVTAPPLMDIWFVDEKHGWAVGAFGTLVQTSNGGQSWQTRRNTIDNEFEYHYYGIIGDSSGRLFIAGEAGGLYRSVDRGETWQTLPSPYPGSWFGVLHNADPDYLLVFGLQGNIYRSDDFGDSWAMASNENTMSLAGGTITGKGKIVLVGAVGAVLQSSDGGQAFSARMQPDRLSLSAILALDEDTFFVVGQGGVRPLVLE